MQANKPTRRTAPSPPRGAAHTICRYHAKGCCWRGDACWFLHVDGPVRPAGGSSSAGPSRLPVPAPPSGPRRRFDRSESSAVAKSRSSPRDVTKQQTEALGAGRQRDDQQNKKGKGKGKEKTPAPGPVQGAKHSDKRSLSVVATEAPEATGREEDLCCICFEKPETYGLLEKCDHCFCIACIRMWRSPRGKSPEQLVSGTMRQCPACRAESAFVIPSCELVSQGEAKNTIIAQRKTRWARIPCKNLARHGDCPFGDECFYRHANEDGSRLRLGHSHAQWVARRQALLDATSEDDFLRYILRNFRPEANYGPSLIGELILAAAESERSTVRHAAGPEAGDLDVWDPEEAYPDGSGSEADGWVDEGAWETDWAVRGSGEPAGAGSTGTAAPAGDWSWPARRAVLDPYERFGFPIQGYAGREARAFGFYPGTDEEDEEEDEGDEDKAESDEDYDGWA